MDMERNLRISFLPSSPSSAKMRNGVCDTGQNFPVTESPERNVTCSLLILQPVQPNLDCQHEQEG